MASTCLATLPRGVLFMALALDAALSFLVLVLRFVVAVFLDFVFLELAMLLLRAVAPVPGLS